MESPNQSSISVICVYAAMKYFPYWTPLLAQEIEVHKINLIGNCREEQARQGNFWRPVPMKLPRGKDYCTKLRSRTDQNLTNLFPGVCIKLIGAVPNK